MLFLNQKNTMRLRDAARILLATTILSSGAAAAQAPTDNTMDQVIVTGTRGRTTEMQSLSPVQVVSSSAIADSGQVDLRTALAAVVPSYMNIASNGFSSSKPVRAATLRGLSGNHVLVLVNGRRRHNTSLLNNTGGPSSGSAPVDLALIPASAVQRIEVLSDGAAAQYGSDAIAGVVNVILRSSKSGGDASVQFGSYDSAVSQEGGVGDSGRTTVANVNFGTGLGAEGFLNVSGEFRHVGTSNVTGPLQPPTKPAWQIFAAVGDPRESTVNRYLQENEVVPAGNTTLLSYNMELPLSSDITFYSSGTAADSYGIGNGTYRSETNSVTIVGVSPPGGYLAYLRTGQRDVQVDVGIKGDNLLGWQWDLGASYGRNDAKMNVKNGLNASMGGASPQQHFDAGGFNVQEALVDLDVKRDFNTGMFSEPMQLAGGVEFRYNTFEEIAGEYLSYANGGYVFPSNYIAVNLRNTAAAIGSPFMTGITPAAAGSYDRSNVAIYADVAQNLTTKWKADAAARFEHYSDFGDTVSGKLSTRYEIIPQLAVRATVNNGFRAPSLAEQHMTVANQGPISLVPGQFIQLNTFNSISYTFPQAAALGAKPLKPERSTNVSFGVVATPFEKLSMTLDVYEVKIKDRIYLTGAFNGVNNVAVRGVLQAAGQDGYQSIQYFTNIGDTRTRGLDFKVNLASDFGDFGTVDWTAAVSVNEQKVERVDAAPPALAAAGLTLIQRPSRLNIEAGLPQNIARLSVDWNKGRFSMKTTESFYSKTRSTNGSFPNNPDYDSVSRPAFITDLIMSYDLSDTWRVSVGANNLFNKRADNIPDIAVPLASSGATLPTPVNISPYGIGGGFYYGRLAMSW